MKLRMRWLRAVIRSPYMPLVLAVGDAVVMSGLIYLAFWRAV